MKATIKPVAKAVKQTMVQFAVSETVNMELPYEGVDFKAAFTYATSGKAFDESIILGFFIGKQPPSVDEYKAEFKKAFPIKAVPTKRNGHSAVIQKLGKASKIQEAIDNGFKPLEAWNDEAHKSKRTRIGNMTMDGIYKLAKPFLGVADEKTAEEKAEKQLLAAFKTMQDCKGKKWQVASGKLAATLQGLGVQLPSDEVETIEE
jgi:hypothetical protein